MKNLALTTLTVTCVLLISCEKQNGNLSEKENVLLQKKKKTTL